MVATVLAPSGGRAISAHPSKQCLSADRRTFIELMQSINFGRIEGLAICDGEPVFDPHPVVFREHKFGGENGPRPELGTVDFLLKQQVVELFALFDELREGTIDVLEFKHGLPFRMVVMETAA